MTARQKGGNRRQPACRHLQATLGGHAVMPLPANECYQRVGVQVYEASLAVLLLGYCEDCRVHAGEAAVSPKVLIETLQVHSSLPSWLASCA